MYLRLASRFSALGHNVDLVLMDGTRRRFESELAPTVRIVDLRRPRLWTSLPAFWLYLRRGRPDVVFSSMPLANGIAAWASRLLLRGPRVIVSERNALLLVMGELESPSAARLRYKIMMRIIRYSYRFASAVVAISDGVAQQVRSIPGLSAEKVHVIYNPAYPERIEDLLSEKPDHPWLANLDTPIVLGVGRLVKQKDFETLLRAVEIVSRRRDVRLVLVGDGEERENLEKLASTLDFLDRFSLHGFCENPLPMMRGASVFVLSSFQEGFGNVLVEAMACGTPVVSTDSPGPREILSDGRYGPLVPVGDPEMLAVAIEQQLDQPTPAYQLQARAREFSLEVSADAYLKLARNVVGDK